MRAPFDGTVRRKALSVVLRDLPPPWPKVDDLVDVVLDGELVVRGRVRTRLGVDIFRVAITDRDGSPL